MFWTAVWWKTRDGCFWDYVYKTNYLCRRKAALTVFTEMCSTSFFMEIICYYNQGNSAGADRENVLPGYLCVIWKLNEAWPVKKDLVTFLQLLKFLILKKGLRHCLKVFNTEKWLHHFLRTLKVFNIEKGLHHILVTLKVFQNSYSVECWWAAASDGCLSYHIYD